MRSINNDVTNDWLPAHDCTRNDIVVMSCELQVTRSVATGRSHSSVCQVERFHVYRRRHGMGTPLTTSSVVVAVGTHLLLRVCQLSQNWNQNRTQAELEAGEVGTGGDEELT